MVNALMAALQRPTNFIATYTAFVKNYSILNQNCDLAARLRAQDDIYQKWLLAQKAPAPSLAAFARSLSSLNDSYWGAQIENGYGAVRLLDALKVVSPDCSANNVVIYEFDTGVLANHPDLAGNIAQDQGYNFVSNNGNANDDNGHGTFVAGVMASLQNNKIGGAGVCGKAKIIPMKVMNKDGNGSSSDIYRALNSAINASNGSNLKIFNLSLSLMNQVAYEIQNKMTVSGSLNATIQASANKNILWSVAAGNDGSNTLGLRLNRSQLPTNLLSVAATDGKDGVARFSNYGNAANISAPGVNLISTGLNNAYSSGSGTSFSAPTVTAAAALLGASNPKLSAVQIRDRMISTAKPLGGKLEGAPRLDIYNLVTGK